MHETSLKTAAVRCLIAAVLAIAMFLLCVQLVGKDAVSPADTNESVVYTSAAKGFGGNVTASVEIAADGRILSVTLEGADETPAVGGAALPALQDAFVAAQSPEIDTVAGATITSEAAKSAVASALQAASAAASTAGGSYTGTAKGFGGDVTATVEIDAQGQIVSVSLEGADETPAVGGAALPGLQDAFLAAQSAEIDTVAGATVTSEAAMSAVAAALASAN